jgi:hypothetical protein
VVGLCLIGRCVWRCQSGGVDKRLRVFSWSSTVASVPVPGASECELAHPDAKNKTQQTSSNILVPLCENVVSALSSPTTRDPDMPQ